MQSVFKSSMQFLILSVLLLGLSPAAFPENGTSYIDQVNGGDENSLVEGQSEAASLESPMTPILYLLNHENIRTVVVTASSYENVGSSYHPPWHAYDSRFSTRWSSYGIGEWIQFEFPEEVTLAQVGISFHRGNERVSSFSIQVSDDGEQWDEVFSGFSTGGSTATEIFSFSESSLHYLRIIGKGNSLNQWTSYSEVIFPALVDPTCSDGIRNQNESGIDCGGVCGGDCCSNNYQDVNLGETGIDCGGVCNSCYLGTTYYVSSSEGDDTDTGLSPTSAWKTIARVNDAELQGGDAVLFKRGDSWREELVIDSSGDVGLPITYGAFGDGHKPRILGSERATSWVQVSGQVNIWRSTTSLSRPQYNSHPASIFFGEKNGSITWGRTLNSSSLPSCENNFAVLGEEYDWCWDNAVYVYSPQNPDLRYNFVEVPQRRGSITMLSHQPQEYIAIDGLEMMFGINYGYNDGWPMNYMVKGLTIQNCHIGYIGIRDAASAMGLVIWHSDMLVKNNDIHDCGRRAVSYNVYTDNSSQPDGLIFANAIFENNTLHNGYHTTGFDISHGDNRSGTFRNFIFRNNLIYDDTSDDPIGRIDDYTSMGIFIDSGSASFENFRVYNNVLKDIKQKHIAVGGDTGMHRNLGIFNNVFYGMNPNLNNYRAQVHISGNHEGLRFNNNIMYGTIDPSNYVSRCLYLNSQINDSNEVASFDYNVYFQEHSTQQLLENYSGSYRMSTWSNYINNTPWDQNSPSPHDPLFISPGANNFFLQSGSTQLLKSGTPVGLPYSGGAPNIGLDKAISPIIGVSN